MKTLIIIGIIAAIVGLTAAWAIGYHEGRDDERRKR